MGIKWFGDDILSDIELGIEKGVKKATIHLQGKVREKISRTQEIRGKGINRRGTDPSNPGEPPKRVSGQLTRSIANETEGRGHEAVGRVGTSLPYGRALEEGTMDMEARPYLRPTLIEEGETIGKLITDGGK